MLTFPTSLLSLSCAPLPTHVPTFKSHVWHASRVILTNQKSVLRQFQQPGLMQDCFDLIRVVKSATFAMFRHSLILLAKHVACFFHPFYRTLGLQRNGYLFLLFPLGDLLLLLIPGFPGIQKLPFHQKARPLPFDLAVPLFLEKRTNKTIEWLLTVFKTFKTSFQNISKTLS